MTNRTPASHAGQSSLPFVVHVDSVPDLVDRAQRSPHPRELVLTTVQPHRRNLRDRLRDADRPQSSFEFTRLVDVARQVAGTANVETESLDRIDRLRALRSILETARDDEADWYTDLAVSMGTDLPEQPETFEALRAEVETVTGFHPDRLDALRSEGNRVPAPADRDSRARIDAVVAAQRALAARVADAPSSDTVVRNATRELAAHGDDTWNEAYGTVERLTVAGAASMSATLADFLRVLGDETDVDVHLHLRAATGPDIRERLSGLCAVAEPGIEVIGS
ncbi:hypothetical protein [Haloparvum sp. PAK95]|uniref:hypothetical protein n=1 Tax=Haloparvum sp. PAK95 TaxID=3418962 RepID=UPI003D2EBBD7